MCEADNHSTRGAIGGVSLQLCTGSFDKMNIKIGRWFEIDGGFGGLYVRVPYVGACCLGGGSTTFDSWQVIRDAAKPRDTAFAAELAALDAL
jgi:hypothetical protein